MMEFLPEREDLVMWFDTQGYRVFVADYGETINRESVYSLWMVNLENDERVHTAKVEKEFEEDIYTEVSNFLADL